MKVFREQTFWLGAMTAFAIVFFGLFAGMAAGHVAIGDSASSARVAVDNNRGGGDSYGDPAPQPSMGADPREVVRTAAEAADVNVKKLDKCIDDGDFKQKVQDEIAKAADAGAQGTPYSLVMRGNEYVVLNGAQPRTAIEAILNDFDASPKATDITVSEITGDDHVRGNNNAEFTIIEYSDIDCPFCTRLHATLKDLVETREDVRWVYRHFPLEALHPHARMKAEATECVADIEGNDEFWTFLDELMS